MEMFQVLYQRKQERTNLHLLLLLELLDKGGAPPSCPISIDCALPLDTKREQAIVMLNLQGSKGNSVAQEDGPSFTLNSMHGHDVHAIAYKPVGFIHPRQLRGIETSNQVGIKTEADISDALTGEGPVRYRSILAAMEDK